MFNLEALDVDRRSVGISTWTVGLLRCCTHFQRYHMHA